MAEDPPPPPPQQTPAYRRGTNVLNAPPYIGARILWPALGFPEVVSPKGASTASNGTNCIYALLLVSEEDIKKAKATQLLPVHVAWHLRCVPWEQRHTRYLPAEPGTNAFEPDQIEVKEIKPGARGDLTTEVKFANDFVMAGLANSVLDFYKKKGIGLTKLYQVRVSPASSSKLQPGQYNLFWINRNTTDTRENRSQEMHVLIENFAKPRRENVEKELAKHGEWGEEDDAYTALIAEYEVEWGEVHKADIPGAPMSMRMRIPKGANARTEVLHPLFVKEAAAQSVRIGHLTDTHCCVRADVFEFRIKEHLPREKVNYNNYNTRFKELYAMARQDCDLLMLTGDLIDYGRGHWGKSAPLGDLNFYHVDRNWFLFYWMLASGENYNKPAYTILGNHDWRLNPYPPVGLYSIANDMNLTEKQVIWIHGDGAGNLLQDEDTSQDNPRDLFNKLFKNPLDTTVESVLWYLLLINPFLDYSARYPGGYSFLMLDWAKEEKIWSSQRNAPLDVKGIQLPVAKSSVTGPQKKLVEWFVALADPAKALAVHAPLVGPRPEWSREELYRGWLRFSPTSELKGLKQRVIVNDSSGSYRKVPIIAINDPPTTESNVPAVIEATFGTILRHRDWLLLKLQEKKVSVALSGHAHRNSVFVISRTPRDEGHLPKGTAFALRANGLTETLADAKEWEEIRPLFVNTISAGPVGYDIESERENRIKLDDQPKKSPGYQEICLANDGTVKSVLSKHSPFTP